MTWISEETWQQIRAEFSEDEKATLRTAVRGETICPRGYHADVDALDAGLAEKLTTLILNVKQKGSFINE